MPPVSAAMITNDAVVFGMLAAILGTVLWTAARPDGFWKKFYSYVPALLLCYLLPSLLNTLGVIDGAASALFAAGIAARAAHADACAALRAAFSTAS